MSRRSAEPTIASIGACWICPSRGVHSVRLHDVLEPGGVLCAYLPTVLQVQELVLALQGNGFQHVETFETLRRSWHVTERSVRPDHRMIGHTGFLTIARRVGRAD